MKRTLLLVRMLAVLGLAAAAAAADLAVIANPGVGVSEVSADELKQIFLGARSSLGGGPVEPVLAEGGAAHEWFLKTYLGKSDSALRLHFKSLVFTGKAAMPKSFGSDAAIVAYVMKTKGAIAYVPAQSAGGAKKLTVK